MEIYPLFNDICSNIIKEINAAQQSIKIAVAWFTNENIFNAILKRLNDNVSVEMIIVNDDINLGGKFALDFQKFISSGGKLFLGKIENPMHHKYCIIDNNVLITGSFNYTYLAESINHENVIVFKGVSDVINSFDTEFKNIVGTLTEIKSLKQYLMENPPKSDCYCWDSFKIQDEYHCAETLRANGKEAKANKIIKLISNYASSKISNQKYIITNVSYEHSKSECEIEKISVNESDVIITLKTEISNSSFWVYGINSPGSWIIKVVGSNMVVKPYLLSHLMLDDEAIVDVLDNNTIYYFGKGQFSPKDIKFSPTSDPNILETEDKKIIKLIHNNKSGKILKCDLYFNRASRIEDKIFSLYEGINSQEKDVHWHCLDVNMQLNRVYNK
jgi:hypothetical protein